MIVLQMILKATQQTKLPLYISVISFSTNTFMNWVLIFGHFGLPAMGVRGAALATVIARLLEAALTIYVVLIRKNVLNGKIREFFGWPKEMMRRIAKKRAMPLERAVPVAPKARGGRDDA